AIKRIESARDAGIDVTADIYPYIASGTGLDSVLPTWVAEGDILFERLADPAAQKRIRLEMDGPGNTLEHGVGPESIIPVEFERPENVQYAGKRLSEIARLRGQSWLDATIDLLLSEGHSIFSLYLAMDEANVALGLQQPWVKISTDASG